MQTLPLDKEGENKDTINILLKWLESYSSRDTMLNAPAPLTSYDIVNELTKIDANTSYENGYDFHYDIARAFIQLQDGHTLYQMPCSSAFSVYLPLVFRITGTQDNYVVSMIPNPAFPDGYSYWMEQTDSVSAFSSVSSITFPELPIVEGEKPEKTIARFVECLSFMARTPAARLAHFMRSIQLGLTLGLYQPKGNITVTGKVNAESSEEVTVTIPWLATPNFSGSDLLQFCPLRNSSISVRSNKVSTSTATRTDGRESESELDEFANQHTDNIYIQKLTKIFKEHPAEIKAFLSQQDTVPSYFPVSQQYRNTWKSSSANSAMVQITTSNLLTGFYDESRKTVIIRIPTWDITNERDLLHWCADFLACLDIYTTNKCEALVIDFSSNGGGTLQLSDLAQYLLFPQSYPIDPNHETPVTTLSTEMEAKQIAADGYLHYDSVSAYKSISELRTYNKTEGTEEVSRTREWRSGFSLNYYAFLSLLPAALPEPDYYISPQNIILLVDGTCGSACCTFVKRAQEMHLAKVIGYGDNLINSIPFDSASFCGCPVYTSDDIIASYENIPGLFTRTTTQLSYTGHHTLSFNPQTPNDPLEFKVIPVDRQYYLFPDPAELYGANPVVLDNIDDILADLSKCALWEVKDSDCKPNTNAIANAIYGYPCTSSGTFDETQCTFSRCKGGFYLTANATCIAIEIDDASASGSSSSTSKLNSVTIAVIVVACVLFVILLIFIILWLCGCLCSSPFIRA